MKTSCGRRPSGLAPCSLPALSSVEGLPAPRLAAFTLVELLTVIAIIGILAAIVIPTVGSVREKAQRAVDGNNLREILKAAQIYATENQDRLPDPQLIPDGMLAADQLAWKWPGILAKNNVLTDPTFYFARYDPAFNGSQPAFILQPGAARNQLHASFTAGRSPSWEFVGGVKMSDHPMTPVIFTRGLQANGAWSATSGVYRDTGGFVAFLGGSVAFYPSLHPEANPPGVLVSNEPASASSARPADIREAIPFNRAMPAHSARVYGIPPPAGAGGMLGTPAGTLATQGP
jgi:prepilin-type N-terminal cleavage/methylation domain-containing protein